MVADVYVADVDGQEPVGSRGEAAGCCSCVGDVPVPAAVGLGGAVDQYGPEHILTGIDTWRPNVHGLGRATRGGDRP
jgi:hypothetical protein